MNLKPNCDHDQQQPQQQPKIELNKTFIRILSVEQKKKKQINRRRVQRNKQMKRH